MGTNTIKKRIVCLAVILVASIFCVGDVLAWNWGVHAYIDDHLGKKTGFNNLNEIYGGTAPDVFNYMFDQPFQRQYLYDQTHDLGFMKVWKAARCPVGEASAFGFVSHNNVWGADSTAHKACTACVDKNKGYVIVKAQQMIDLGVPSILEGLPSPVIEEIYHNFVEAGVDILVKKLDPNIGKKLASAALVRNPTFPLLLVKAYAKEFSGAFDLDYFEAAKIIARAETSFRKDMVLYGQALMQDDATAVHLLSEQLADIAEAYLGAFDIPLPAPKEMLIPLIGQGIWGAILLCGGDFQTEIEGTIMFVRDELKKHGVNY
jgi:hypothetical protein